MLFEIEVEVRDSAVTLSAALAKYIVKKNQGMSPDLKVMPFKTKITDCSICDECRSDKQCPVFDYYGWDINPKPEDTGLSQDYIDSLDVLQWNEEERKVGFLMNNPNVTGLLITYGMRDAISVAVDTGRPVKLYVRPRTRYGRTQYIIERMKTIGLRDRLDVWLTRWRVRLMK